MNLERLMISVSGVRGIVGEGLTPEIVLNFAQVFGSEYPGKIVVGRDSRITGEMLTYAVWSGLMSVGCDVIDIGVASTPTVELVTEQPDYAAGIIITASHNPKQWNALKLLASDGMFLRPEQGERIVERVTNRDFGNIKWDKMGRLILYPHAADEHVQSILDLPVIDPKWIRSKSFKVVVDCCNGAGATILPNLLDAFNCHVVYLNKEPNGLFNHDPEPVPANLRALQQSVIENKADLGIAVDPDVDRLALVSEKGECLGEEYTLALATQFIIKKTPGDIVVNASTTRAIDDVARRAGCRVHRTKVGEIHVAGKAKQIGAVIAGEGNGGVMYPELHIGRDAPVGIALILQYLAETERPISELYSEIPHYHMIKAKVELGFGSDAKAVVQRLMEKQTTENISTVDGLKVLFADSWVHVRASNTEPIIRIIAEAPTLDQAEQMIEDYTQQVDNIT